MATPLKELSANNLRVARRILSGKVVGLSEEDRKIGNRLLRSLKRRKVSLKNWIDNKDGVRNRAAWRQERKDVKANLSMMGRPEIRESPIEKREVARRATPEARADAEAKGWITKADDRLKKFSNKDPEAVSSVDTGIPFGPKTEKASGRSPGYPFREDKRAAPRRKPSRKPKQDIKDKASEVRAMSSMMGRPEIKEEVGRSPGYPFREDKRAAPRRKPSRIGGPKTKYSIKGGDTLSALAKKGGTTLGAIRKANPGRFPTAASLNKIKVGEKINMPPNVKASTPYDVKTVRKTTPPTPKPKPSRKAGKDTGKVKRFDPDIAAALPEKAGLMPWNWKQLTGPEDRSPGKRTYKTLFGDLEVDSSVDTSYPGEEYKKGGRLKKSVKKAKAKPRKAKAKTRKRAALRGHRAELRGG